MKIDRMEEKVLKKKLLLAYLHPRLSYVVNTFVIIKVTIFQHHLLSKYGVFTHYLNGLHRICLIMINYVEYES